ncbi:MAG TPA: class I SAM-dependent methyltransferase [Phycisphaerae bacterium]|nr:class I SAM-dependent methyltransferase [Phycisphaerae bacterium]HNU44082.1 class I SAM-dependent methyltransferase [Phycisphaerae bacterium]
MTKSRRPAVQRYHDRVAGHYDHSYDDAFWLWHDALTWDYLRPFLPREQGVPLLDLGCGTGKWAAKLVKSGYQVACVDISAAMLDQARQRIERMGAGTRATFTRADLCDLSTLPAGEFAAAVALGEPIGCTEEPRQALKQIRRLLRPFGVLVATFDNRFAGIDYYVEKGEADELARFLRTGRTHWLTRGAEERFPIFTWSPDELRKLLRAAGFEVLDLVGKTVLPMRQQRALLESASARRAWSRIERSLARDSDALGRAPHLQVACRVTASVGGREAASGRGEESAGP